MDTVMSVNAYGANSEAAVLKVQNEINRLDRLFSIGKFSIGKAESEISALNRDKKLTPSAETLEVIARSKELSSITNGAFDITTEPLVSLWGFYSNEENRVPSKTELESALKSVSFENIVINGNQVELKNGASVDLGAVAKGYASGRAAELLKENGVSSALISLGGNVRAVGKKPDGALWAVAIVNPDDNSKNAGVLLIDDKAVVTSGGYQRFFEQDGKIYHHIIDPKTGCPAQNGLKSVTVVSGDDMLADAMSTALFVNGIDGARELISKAGGELGAVFITDENDIYITEDLIDSFKAEEGYEVKRL